jgi:hypothetical protein
MVELYTHMRHGSSSCRVLQADLAAKTWRMGHYEGGSAADMIVAASGVFPAGVTPWTLRLEGDPDGTERFLFNGTLVQAVDDTDAPNPTTGARVGFGEFSHANFTPVVQVRSFAGQGARYLIAPPPPPPTSPRIERFTAQPLPGTVWAIPSGSWTGVSNYTPSKARPGAPLLEEDEVPMTTPGGSPLDDFRGQGSGSAIYDNGWVYDGYGWRNAAGQAITEDGKIIQTGGLPPNKPPPGGQPPWAWTPPTDPLTGEPSILTVHFCFFDQWL